MEQRSTSIYYVSMDNGNWGNKSVRGDRATVIRNVTLDYDGSDDQFNDLVVATHEDHRNDIPTDSLRFSFEGEQCVVGEMCYTIDPMAKSRTGYERYGTKEWKRMVAGAFATLYPQRSGTIALTFAIPVSQFRASLIRTDAKGHEYEIRQTDYIREQLSRSWEVEVDDRCLTYEVDPDLLDLVPEGYGTLAYLCIAENGRSFTDRTLAEGRVILIDIGGFTTDILTFERLKPLGYNESLTTGLIKVRNKVERAIKRRFNRDDIPAPVLDKIISSQKYKHAGYPAVEVSDIIEAATVDLMDEILNEWTENLGRGADFDAVVIAGGGGPVIAPILKNRIVHGDIRDLPKGKSHDSNAWGGYYRRMMQREAARIKAAREAAAAG